MENLVEQEVKTGWADDEMTIDLKEIFFMLLYKWKVILIFMLSGAVLFGMYHVFLLHPSYRADASIYITNTDSVVTFSDLQMSAALTDDYARIIESRTVLNRVIEELELDLDYEQLRQLITVVNPDSTHIVEIQVTCSDPELSRDITNALMNISVSQIYQVIGSSEPNVIDFSTAEAVLDVTPSLLKYLLMGAMLGAFAICAFLIMRMLMDTTVKSEEDVERYLKLPVLAAVPYFRELNGK